MAERALLQESSGEQEAEATVPEERQDDLDKFRARVGLTESEDMPEDELLLRDGDDEEDDDVVGKTSTTSVDEVMEAFKTTRLNQTETDPLSIVPGVSSATTIRAAFQAVQRGLIAKKLESSNTFEISFDVYLNRTSKSRRCIAHFAVSGRIGSQLPRICIKEDTSELIFFVRQGHARAKLHTPPLPLEQSVNVVFRCIMCVATVSINGKEVAMATAHGLDIPVPAKVFAYICSASDIPADALVGNAQYRWRHVAWRPRVQATTIFEVPADDVHLMEEVSLELARAAKWAKFDAFFGLVVFANTISMGAETECDCPNEPIWKVLSNVFLSLFLLEICLRAYFAGWNEFKVMLASDHWLQFDILVVTASIAETWVFDNIDGGGMLSVVRLFRLLKLIKMVRLLRTFRQLAMLVEGIFSSLPTLFWAIVLLSLAIFIFSILLVRITKWNLRITGTAEEKLSVEPFLSLPSTMWTLVTMITFDHWIDYIRRCFFVLGDVQGIAMGVVLLFSVSLSGLCLMNLVVGILCNTAFKLEARQLHMLGSGRLLQQQHALVAFHAKLRSNVTNLLKNHRYIGTEQFFEILDEADMPELLETLGMTRKDFATLSESFREGNNIEIDGIIEAVGIIVLQTYFSKSISNSLKRNKDVTALRPVDLLFFSISLRQLESCILKVEQNGRSMCALTYDALSVLYDYADKSHTLLRVNQDTSWSPPVLPYEVIKSSLTVRKLEETANQFNLDTAEQRLLMPIDILFGSVIAINGVFVGIQTGVEDGDLLVYIIDLMFTLLFILEFVLRGIMGGNLRYVHQSEETDTDLNFFEQANRKVTRFLNLKSKMRLWIFPPCPPGGAISVLFATCMSLRQPSVLFDFLVISISIFESLVLQFLRSSGALTGVDTSALSVLRVFRLFRLAKLLRVFKLFPQLQKLVFTLADVWHQVFWALTLIVLVLYTYAIFLVNVQAENEGTPIYEYAKNLRAGFLTGWQITTFDSWDEVVVLMRDSPFSFCGTVGVAIFLGLGLMNMAVGVLCESALHLRASSETEHQRDELITFLAAMKDLQETCVTELGDQILPASCIENAVKLKLRPQMGELKADTWSAETFPLSPEALAHGQSKEFKEKLEMYFQSAGLPSLLLKRICDKVDWGRSGFVTVDELTKGALVTKEDLAKVELYGCTIALRDVREKVASMSENVLNIHIALQHVLEDMEHIINRKGSEKKDPLRNPATLRKHVQHYARSKADEYDASSLRAEAEHALYTLTQWPGEGNGTSPGACGHVRTCCSFVLFWGMVTWLLLHSGMVFWLSVSSFSCYVCSLNCVLDAFLS
eukprot:TRINITY_DN22207_c0_g1_i1.p1 TRINITY_DN22207_c0_g1~~TRINITY_DN22207_c0_g1_i1.p1  ORF type:complete len:1316 (-),score=258.04 TRINITY_DN22207_c0_g1_i1:241-4188(-)